MWEVDPETKSKLATLRKRPGNNLCIDCTAPSPQWASPKFGTFICLTCAGLHRGLGVHISFVRSIQMDSFKAAEIKRMELGGNDAWKQFWEGKNPGERWGRPGEGGDKNAERRVEGRYAGEVGEEWKERLGCRVEGREFAGMPVKERKEMAGRGTDASTARTGSPLGMGGKSLKEQNEDFFARKGGENAGRPEGVAPSQGGKYAGFGSEPSPPAASKASAGALPGVGDFQQDPVAALSKGFWGFAGAVGKGAKTLNEGFIQPTAQKVAESEFTAQARMTAAQAAKSIQTGTKGAAEKFNHFVENTGEGGGGAAAAASRSRAAPAPERQDFWDSFGDAGADKRKGSSSIGTAAMRKGGKAGGEGGKDEGWGDW